MAFSVLSVVCRRVLGEGPDAFLLNALLKGFEGVHVGREVVLPHRRAILVIDDLKRPAIVRASEAVDVDLNGHAMPRHPAGERRELKLAVGDRGRHPSSLSQDLHGAARSLGQLASRLARGGSLPAVKASGQAGQRSRHREASVAPRDIARRLPCHDPSSSGDHVVLGYPELTSS